MITFLSILFVLMAVNAILLVFSMNSVKDRFKKTIQKISDNNVIKLPPTEISETKYKKAV